MRQILWSVFDRALWAVDTLDDILVQAALSFGAVAPFVAEPSGDPTLTTASGSEGSAATSDRA